MDIHSNAFRKLALQFSNAAKPVYDRLRFFKMTYNQHKSGATMFGTNYKGVKITIFPSANRLYFRKCFLGNPMLAW